MQQVTFKLYTYDTSAIQETPHISDTTSLILLPAPTRWCIASLKLESAPAISPESYPVVAFNLLPDLGNPQDQIER